MAESDLVRCTANDGSVGRLPIGEICQIPSTGDISLPQRSTHILNRSQPTCKHHPSTTIPPDTKSAESWKQRWWIANEDVALSQDGSEGGQQITLPYRADESRAVGVVSDHAQ